MDYDLIIIGSGIGGSALAAVMASAGYKVLALEQSHAFEDRVRGEWIAPWGVAETQRLGLYDVLKGPGGAHELIRHVTYDPALEPEAAEAEPLPLSMLLPDAGGPLTLGHPHHCQTLLEHARACGGTVLRGVSDAEAALGANPSVTYSHEGETVTATCRLVVSAEGRMSGLRDQAGITLHQDKPHHMFAGMLVEGADDWPDDLQAIGTEGDFAFLAFPQGGGKIRVYGSFALEERQRFKGEDGPQKFLDAFDLSISPRLKAIAGARPAGPVLAYFNNDSWTDKPFAEGLVLVGDAAGWNDPILGQGLSIAYRDVRIVSDILKGADDWSAPGLFDPYAEERAERMRRLRFACQVKSVLDAEFGPEADARRADYHTRAAADPTLAFTSVSTIMGPETVPAEAFTEESRQKMLNG